MVKKGELIQPPIPKGWGTPDQPWPPMELFPWLDWAKKQPDPAYLIKDFIPADAAVLMSGRAKRGRKTWLAFEIAIALAGGKTPIKHLTPVKAVPVLVLELEGPMKLTADRWDMLLKPYGIEPGDVCSFQCPLYYMHRADFLLDDPVHMEAMKWFVRQAGIKFMVVDTLAMANRADENSVQQIGETMRRIKDLRAAMSGGTVMYLHHLRKPAEVKGASKPDIDTEIRGTSALSGFYDVHLAVREPDDETADYLDLVVRSSDAMERYFKLFWSIDSEYEKKATLEMVEESPDMVDEGFANEKLGLLLDDALYTTRDLASTWGTSQDVAAVVKDLLLGSGAIIRAGKNKVKRS